VRRRWSLLIVVAGFAVTAALVGMRAGGQRHPAYAVPDLAAGSAAFAHAMEAYTSAPIVGGNRVDLLLNGDEIFPALLEAIRGARQTITYAQYFFQDGPVAREVIDALAERCRAGVAVHVLLDGVGTMKMPRAFTQELERASCHVKVFRPLGRLSLVRANHRNHRRILVVDGRVGFTGGSGVSSKWLGDGRTADHWRETDARVEGPAAAYLQAAFVGSWLAVTGEMLAGDRYFPARPASVGGVRAQVVKSSPEEGGDAMYRLFLLAVASARRSILLTNPYFLPDDALTAALVRAVAHGVSVKVLVPGVVDHELVRKASRAEFGRMLQAGVQIYEYGVALLHAKTMVVDGVWATVGSTNLDNRSFALNEELNLAIHDSVVAHRLEQAFDEDVARAAPVRYEAWAHRPLKDRLAELLTAPIRNLM
jgi:cardiolipin synthase